MIKNKPIDFIAPYLKNEVSNKPGSSKIALILIDNANL